MRTEKLNAEGADTTLDETLIEFLTSTFSGQEDPEVWNLPPGLPESLDKDLEVSRLFTNTGFVSGKNLGALKEIGNLGTAMRCLYENPITGPTAGGAVGMDLFRRSLRTFIAYVRTQSSTAVDALATAFAISSYPISEAEKDIARDQFLWLGLCRLFDDSFKFQCSYLFSLWCDDLGQVPPQPFVIPSNKRGITLFGRRVSRDLLNRAAHHHRRDQILFSSILTAKKALLPVDWIRQAEAFREHRKLLTARPPPGDVEALRRRTRDLVAEVFSPVGNGVCHAPSQNASVESARSLYGSCADLTRRLGYRDLHLLWRVWPSGQSAYIAVDPEDLRTLWRESLFETLSSPVRVSPCSVLEALKVRMITKGPAGPYWVGLTLQKVLWKQLSSHYLFQLCGSPDSAELLGSAMHGLEAGDYLVSGDYKDSTNRISKWLSEMVWDEICGRMMFSFEIREAGRRMLTGHTLDYTGTPAANLGPLSNVVKQENGQLMGSPLSFIVLNIANAVVTLPFVKSSHGKFQARFNGDDTLFIVQSSERYWDWTRFTSTFGLVPSVGKNYVSKRFGMINSHLYEFIPARPDDCTTCPCTIPRPYVNLGILFGKGRVLTDNPGLLSGGPWGVSARTRVCALIKDFPTSIQGKLLDEFIRRNRTLLNSFPGSWWLPPSSGGLGLPIVNESRYAQQRVIGKGHLVLANYLRHAPLNDFRTLCSVIRMTIGEPADCANASLQARATEWLQESGAKFAWRQTVQGITLEQQLEASLNLTRLCFTQLIDGLSRSIESSPSESRRIEHVWRELRIKAFKSPLGPARIEDAMEEKSLFLAGKSIRTTAGLTVPLRDRRAPNNAITFADAEFNSANGKASFPPCNPRVGQSAIEFVESIDELDELWAEHLRGLHKGNDNPPRSWSDLCEKQND